MYLLVVSLEVEILVHTNYFSEQRDDRALLVVLALKIVEVV